MAEIFGTVAGAIGIAAVFNNCVDCFEYIQIARHLGEDLSKYQLRLDIAKCRLSRWGAAIDFDNDPRFHKDGSKDLHKSDRDLAKRALEQIVESFDAAQKASLSYKPKSKEEDMAICSTEDLDTVSQRLHNRFRAFTMKRENRVGLGKKVYWAVYEKERMGELITSIFTFLNDLEQVFPATTETTSRLVEMEIEEVNDEQELKMIQNVAKELDPVLEDTTKNKLQEITGKNSAGRVGGKGRTNIGHTFVNGSSVPSHDFKDNTSNHVDEVNGDETARVNIGNTYGGKGFWD